VTNIYSAYLAGNKSSQQFCSE